MSYKILPFNYEEKFGEILITGLAGDFYFLSKESFSALISHALDSKSTVYQDLKSKHFIADSKENLYTAIDSTANRYRSKKGFLKYFTVLHMMVITLRCNQKCQYCQVSCAEENASQYDMKPQTARKIIDFIFQTPSKSVKIEFQGGESLLNWETIQESVLYAKELNKKYSKNLEFVICTNLTSKINNKMDFIKEHNIAISSSLDGTKEIHDYHRIHKDGSGTYDVFMKNLNFVRANNSEINNVGALMTTTSFSLTRIKDIVDEYIYHSFDGIFLRSINPYGFANENKNKIGYGADAFVRMYKEGLEYIIQKNKEGIFFPEYYTTLLLTRILTPFPTAFVDLQSPSGAGISGVIYDYNGDIYPADEGRMLARMGDQYFKMGNVYENSYQEVFNGKMIRKLVENSCLEIMPVCSECVYSPYCGADPIRNYLETKDVIGDRIDSDFCRKNTAIFDYLFSILKQNDPETMDILWSWIQRKPIVRTK